MPSSSRIYRCPKCHAALNPEHAVVLLASFGPTRVLVGLHPEPGNYEVHLPPQVDVQPGTQWTFACPVCRADLRSQIDDKLCAVELLEGTTIHELLFSRVAGEKVTFVVRDRTVHRWFGQHADEYVPHLVNMKYTLL